MIEALFWLTLKHFVCDYPLQAMPYQYKNKGTYGHPGGILHGAIHVFGTTVVMAFFTPYAILLGVLDGLIHYHIDWAKMNIGKKFNLLPTNSEWFWILLGLDQLLHYLTYFAIVKIAL